MHPHHGTATLASALKSFKPEPCPPSPVLLFIQFQPFLLGPRRAPGQGEGKPGSAAPPASNQPVTPHKSCHCLDLGLLGRGSVQSRVSKQEPEAALSHLNLLPPSPGSRLGTSRGAPASGKDQRSWLGSLAGLWKGQMERGVQVARDPNCRPPLTWQSPPPRKARPGGLPTHTACPSHVSSSKEGERTTGVLAPLPGRQAAHGRAGSNLGRNGSGAEATAPRGPVPAAASLPAPPAGLIAESGLIGNANGN